MPPCARGPSAFRRPPRGCRALGAAYRDDGGSERPPCARPGSATKLGSAGGGMRRYFAFFASAAALLPAPVAPVAFFFFAVLAPAAAFLRRHSLSCFVRR